eukprot:413176-Hanusia_phi.AAC.2
MKNAQERSQTARRVKVRWNSIHCLPIEASACLLTVPLARVSAQPPRHRETRCRRRTRLRHGVDMSDLLPTAISTCRATEGDLRKQRQNRNAPTNGLHGYMFGLTYL